MTETKAVVLYRCGRPFKIEKLRVPTLKKGQVLVKIYAAGLCRSQMNEIRGLKGPDPYLPHTLGHEGSGVVEAVGLGVKKIRVKDPVVISWIKSRGLEGAPAAYQNSRGETVHSGPVSTFMEYAVISENRLVKIPDGMPLREAALLGCAVLTGAGIVFHTLRLKPGQSLAVFGAGGGVGLGVIAAARIAGAHPIIAVDVTAAKLKKARVLGATHTFDASRSGEVRGVDAAVEVSGNRKGMEAAFQSVRDKGGVAVIAGNLPAGEKISLDPFLLIKGKKIIGSWGGESDPDRDIPRYAEYFSRAQWNLGAMIAAEYPLKNIREALGRFQKGLPGRILIRIEKDS